MITYHTKNPVEIPRERNTNPKSHEITRIYQDREPVVPVVQMYERD